jgi:hypothetical protein
MKKSTSLNYIEDTKKQHKKIVSVAKKATREAVLQAKENNVEVTYLKGSKVVSESPSGKITVISSLNRNLGKRVVVGSKSILS